MPMHTLSHNEISISQVWREDWNWCTFVWQCKYLYDI